VTDLLFIAGMHRSLTSAFAGAALLLQNRSHGAMIGPSLGNRKGHFEPVAVVEANKSLLAARQRVWFDCRPLPAATVDCQEAEVADLAAVLRRQVQGDGLQIIKDPRISLFVPAWFGAARQAGLRPHLVAMVRQPAASAASLCRRDKLEGSYAVAIWLRYMLDVERNSREQPRKFIDAAAYVADPVVTLAAVADGLGVTWDRRPEGARADLLSFVESSLPAPPPVPMASDLLEMANEVHRLLLAQETPQTSGQLDRIAAEFNDRTQALYDAMVVRELARCLHDRWELDATRLRLVAAEGALQQSGASPE
jgi:hypothetical protein